MEKQSDDKRTDMESLPYLLYPPGVVGLATSLSVVRKRRDSFPGFFDFSSNTSRVLGDIQRVFDCAELPYGYYADEANGCAIFHVCLPYINFIEVITRHFSFFCGEGMHRL
ncbi:hypothetical protein E2C01_070729 [Portunus trituberculatus]|uniref:Uncharacterized protein n=1 Tax=Portunus trituberculatus TaxID=210409 RepID=A0A5B7I326_PORTR|nr:hypothetical protein [Portunus trituberculatus]